MTQIPQMPRLCIPHRPRMSRPFGQLGISCRDVAFCRLKAHLHTRSETDPKEFELALIYILETEVRPRLQTHLTGPAGETCILAADLSQVTRANLDMETAKHLAGILKEFYPEMLHSAIFIDAPKLFTAAWKVCSLLSHSLNGTVLWLAGCWKDTHSSRIFRTKPRVMYLHACFVCNLQRLSCAAVQHSAVSVEWSGMGWGGMGRGVVWCGVVWCGVVWCGVVWCGVVWCGVVWCGVVWCGVVWCGVVCRRCCDHVTRRQ